MGLHPTKGHGGSLEMISTIANLDNDREGVYCDFTLKILRGC